MNIYSIYLATNSLEPDKHYIGYDKNWPNRQKDHLHDSNCLKSKSSKNYFHKAIKKYGFENFLWEIIYQSKSLDDIKEKEKHFIIEYKTHYIKGVGYNMTDGGDGGDTSQSPNFIESLKRRNVKGSNNPMFGKKGIDNPNFGKKYQIIKKDHHANNIPVVCEGICYNSVTDAQNYYKGIKLRKRLDSIDYPEFYRLKPTRKYPKKFI